MKSLKIVIKVLLWFLISLVGVLLLLFISMNLDFSRTFFARQINHVFEKTGLPIGITSVKRIMPSYIRVQGVALFGQGSDTIIFAEDVSAVFSPLQLLRKKVILHSVFISGSKIKLEKNSVDGKLNIAEAFSKPGKKPTSDTVVSKKPWDVIIEKAGLSETSFIMNDTAGNINVVQIVKEILITADKMSIAEKTILLKSLEIAGASGSITIGKSEQKEAGNASTPWKLGLSGLTLNDINLKFNSTSEKLLLEVMLGDAAITANNIDPALKLIDFKKIALSKTSINIRKNNQKPSKKTSDSDKSFVLPWNIRGEKIELQDISFRLSDSDDSTNIVSSPSFGVSGLDLTISDILIDSSNVIMNVKNSKLTLNNGFSLNSFKGKIDSHSGKTGIDLTAETTNSQINLVAEADRSLPDIFSEPDKIGIARAVIKNTIISSKDLYFFRKDLKENILIQSLAKIPVKINANVGLADSVVSINQVSVSQRARIAINADGKIYNIFDPANTTCNIKFSVSDVNPAMLKETLNLSGIKMNLPDFNRVALNGTVTDSLKSPRFDLSLLSDLGNIGLTGSVDLGNDRFTLHSSFDRLMLNKILNNKILGSFSGSGEITGKGIKKKSVSAEILLLVDSLWFKGYDYTSAKISCKILPGEYNANLIIDDPSVSMNMTATISTADSLLAVRTSGLFSVDLYALNLYKDTLSVKGSIEANLKKGKKFLETDLSASNLTFTDSQRNILIRQLNTSVKSDSASISLTGESDFFAVNVRIEKPSDELKTIIPGYKSYLESFKDPKQTMASTRILYLPEMNAKVNISYHEVVDLFVKGLHFDNINMDLVNRTSYGRLDYSFRGRDIRYKMLEIGMINSQITDSSGVVKLHLSADTCMIFSNPANKLRLTSLHSGMQSLTSFSVIDKQDVVVYGLEISSEADSNKITFKIPSKQVIMNRVKWNIDSEDLFSINLTDFKLTPSLKMHSDDSYINFITEEEKEQKIFRCDIGNVRISSLIPENILQGNPAGFISGSATYGFYGEENRKIFSDFTFKDVSWAALNFKNIALKGSYLSEKQGEYEIDIAAQLDSADITLKGKKPASGNLNLDALFKLIPIKTAQPFVKKFLSDLSGYISGGIKLSSEDNVQNLTGDLLIDNGNLRIKALNSLFRLPSDRIKFTGKKMIFNNFKVLDSLSNELTVDGTLDFSDKNSLLTDLDISSSNLQVLNKKEEKNAIFYGDVFIDSKFSIKGPVTSPELKGKIVLAGGTEIFFRQLQNINLSESEQVLTFVSGKPSSDQNNLKPDPGAGVYNKASVDAVVEIDPATRINIKLSQRMFNISLMIQGGGEVNFNMLDNKQVTLTGKYVVSEGTADLKMIGWPNKSFRISNGGFIRWDGKLEDPELQVEAQSKVRSSYTNPVDNKQRDVDFNVLLKLTNRLSTMDVLFTITTADQYLMSIINTLSPQEQMRQAITILLFEKIDLPGISTSSKYMSEQVNQLVASQLNQLTKTTIKGIDISFGLDTYVQSPQTGSQQTKTSLSYDVKKNLLNNRAQMEISGRLNDYSNQQSSSNLSLNNFSFKYQLDSLGTKFIKVYNERSYEDVFEGEVIKTGVGFTYRKNYRSLSEIWKKKEKSIKPKAGDK